MIKLKVRQANHPDIELKLERDVAVVGRTPGCDVVVNQPYVSKRHLRIYRGVVVVDLGSSNGTFVDGKRLVEPTLVHSGEIQLGDGDVFLRVQAEDEGPHTTPSAGPAQSGVELENLRWRCAQLEGDNRRLVAAAESLAAPSAELEALRARCAQLEGQSEQLRAQAGSGADSALQAENGRLQQRIESLKEQLEAGRQADGDSVQTRLLMQRVEQLQGANEQLQRQLEHAQAQSKSGGAVSDGAARETVERLQRDNAALRERLAAAEAAGARPVAPPTAAAELFLRLQTENSTLKRRLAESEGRAPGVGGSEAPAKLLQELVELRAQNAAFRAQAAAAGARPVPAPAFVPGAIAAGPGSDVRALFAQLAEQDADARGTALEASPEEFVVVQQFKLVRHVERIVTRLAGDFIQLYHANTMLPDVEGNFRELVARCVDGQDSEARRELLDYFAQLSRWLVASLGAHRQAAARFAERLKLDLSEATLTASAPIPAFKRLSGQADAELWRRTCAYLRELTPDMVEDRLEKLSRESALELLGDHGTGGDAHPA